MTSSPPDRSGTVRVLRATISFLIGVIAALIGGMLQRLDGKSLPQAIEYGCSAFVATVMFVFAIVHFFDRPKDGGG